ncbi:hypothetical protein [Microvirga alba]|uniref:hypothetical protein n=1 Tax=Microvirga alba TaxID=2791025 RepID=UPI001E3324AE|nr:hypothetical protein [Microvirga alba]
MAAESHNLNIDGLQIRSIEEPLNCLRRNIVKVLDTPGAFLLKRSESAISSEGRRGSIVGI